VKARSIRIRLLLFALVGILVSLAVAGAGLVALFGRHVERRAAQELDNTIAVLAGNLAFAADGALRLDREPADPAYRTPLSGRYWQVGEQPTPAALRSVSLWDGALATSASPPSPGSATLTRAPAPDGRPLLVRETAVILDQSGRDRVVHIAAAVATEELDALRRGFARDLFPALAAFGLVILAGAWFQVRAGLAPLSEMRGGLRRIRSGEAPVLSGRVPSEIEPLVGEINGLLAERARETERARNRAADLAHGMKTPLTALAGDAERLAARGEHAAAQSIAETAAAMRRIIERELARARTRTDGVGGSPLRPAVEGIARTLRLTPAGESLAFVVNVPETAAVAADPDDLHDVLGNLMENAARAARAAVTVSAQAEGATLLVDIRDDGPGADPDTMRRLTARGARLDERGGAGLGLAIVSDILAAYGAELEFSRDAAGMCVRFRLPAARTGVSDSSPRG
jgi:signal transduction histidine kinase